jgi:hypothetical protein
VIPFLVVSSSRLVFPNYFLLFEVVGLLVLEFHDELPRFTSFVLPGMDCKDWLLLLTLFLLPYNHLILDLQVEFVIMHVQLV